MKILLLRTEEPIVHTLEQRYLNQIRAVDPSVEFAKHLEDIEVLVGFPADLVSLPFSRARNLKWLHAFSAGMEKVLTPELKASDIIVSNSSGVHAIPIAEHVLGFILIFAKKFYQSFQNQQKRQWQNLDGMVEIRGTTVVVVGLGHIGKEIAKLAAGAGMRVIAVDRAEKGKLEFVQELYSTEQMEKALLKADYVVSSVPYTVGTHHLFDIKKFRTMKQSAVFINISRGRVVNEQELVQALEQKVIAGAALDVTEVEPLPKDNPLWQMDNVVITPHHSSHTKQCMDRTIDLFCENLKAYIKGERLPNLVDKQKGY